LLDFGRREEILAQIEKYRAEKRRWYPQVILVRHRKPIPTGFPVPQHGVVWYRPIPGGTHILRHEPRHGREAPGVPGIRGYIAWEGSPHTDSSEARAKAEQKAEELRGTPKYAGELLKPRIVAKPEFRPVPRR